MGTLVTPQRREMYQEELDFRSAISEFTASKQASVTNFINLYHFERKQWILNGAYSEVAVNGLDGMWPITIDMEVLFFTMTNLVSGSSGITEADIELFTAPGVSGGSIFSTTPKMDSNVTNNSYMIKDIVTPANDVNPAGTTLPVFTTNLFNKGQALQFNLLQSMFDVETMSVEIMYRPR